MALVITLYSAKWCPHCRKMAPVWAKVKQSASSLGVSFREVDGDSGEVPRDVRGFPTIRASKGGKFYQYRSGADFTSLRLWVYRLSML